MMTIFGKIIHCQLVLISQITDYKNKSKEEKISQILRGIHLKLNGLQKVKILCPSI